MNIEETMKRFDRMFVMDNGKIEFVQDYPNEAPTITKQFIKEEIETSLEKQKQEIKESLVKKFIQEYEEWKQRGLGDDALRVLYCKNLIEDILK